MSRDGVTLANHHAVESSAHSGPSVESLCSAPCVSKNIETQSAAASEQTPNILRCSFEV